MAANGPAEAYVVDMNTQEMKFVVQSALGQWTKPLEFLFNGDETVKIAHWNMSMNNTDCEVQVKPKTRDKVLQKFISEYDTDNFIHIFVAPISWAAKFRKSGKFKIVGPAFGSNSDISLYAKKALKKKDDIPIKIGVIDGDITSNLLFKLYHFLLTEQLKTDIYDIVDGHIQSPPSTSHSVVVEGYLYEAVKDPIDRLDYLCLGADNDDALDFAIFTDKDIATIEDKNNSTSYKFKEQVRKILDIDPIISHFFNKDYIPRAVYCIHETQYNAHQSFIRGFFKKIKNKTK
jgi:5'-3' exonuclease